MEILKKQPLRTIVIDGIFLILLNVVLMTIIGYLTLDSEANLNSRVGAILLSFFLPVFIVFNTQNMNGLERMLKFGIGFITYILMAISMVGLPESIATGLVPCLTIALGTLYYGKYLTRTMG